MAAYRLAAVLCLTFALGCKRQEKRTDGPPSPVPVLGPIAIEEVTPPGRQPTEVTLDTPALEAALRQALEARRVFAIRAGDAEAPAWARVSAEIALEEVEAAGKAAARAAVRLRIDARPEAVVPRHWNEDVQAGAEIVFDPKGTPDRSALYQRLVARTLKDLADGYMMRQALWTGDKQALQSALAAESPSDLKIEAIRVIGERRMVDRVPVLLELLDHPEEPVRDATLGALVELRDPRAVTALARQRSMKDEREMRKVLEAMATIGGEEAASYLDFVAQGHESEEIREMASKARKRLDRKATGTSESPSK